MSRKVLIIQQQRLNENVQRSKTLVKDLDGRKASGPSDNPAYGYGLPLNILASMILGKYKN